MAEGVGSVVVSTTAGHTGGPGSIPGHGSHDIFGVKTWLSTSGTVYPSCTGESHQCWSPLKLGCQRTTKDDKHPGSDHPGSDHPGSDHPQGQHRKFGLA